MNYLLDTNIVSLAAKQNRQILQNIAIIDAQEANICISCINYFEVRRGFLAVDAPHLTAVFD
jgi:tRNA(fMet)-specific endonuclease VapC